MPTIEYSRAIGGRVGFASLCNERKFQIAYEIGTDRGVFANDFLNIWRGEMLYCVDPYEPYNEMFQDRLPDLLMATHLLAAHARRSRVVKATSLSVAQAVLAKDFPHPSFVYIDANHVYEEVAGDVLAWWVALLPGGILAGDDFDDEHHGVMKAVGEFADKANLKIQLVSDYNRPPSWFMEKPK